LAGVHNQDALTQIHPGNVMEEKADRPCASDPKRRLTPEARRALMEAEARRKAAAMPPPLREIGGRGGPDPVRYGDWEIDGIAVDF
jgi:hypothetical protein